MMQDGDIEEASEEYLASPQAMLPTSVTPLSGRGRARYEVDDSLEGLRTTPPDMAVCQSLQNPEVRVIFT